MAGPIESRAQADADLNGALSDYLQAPNSEAALAFVDRIVGLNLEFEELFQTLKGGRRYRAEVPRGRIIRTHQIGGVDHHYFILIPESYDPSRPWPVRWDLHGGMGQPEWKAPDGSWNGWSGVSGYDNGYIVVAPAGWWDSMWWEASQVDNFRAILDDLKRTWNVDENRVFMFGNSDGAIGEWFYAMRDPDPWGLYVGYVGFPARLTNRIMRADGQMHLSNLEGQFFYLRNGVHDRVVNIGVARRYLDVVRTVDVEIDYAEHADAGHNLNLTMDEAEEPIFFFRDRRRDPLPERVSWSTERTDRYNRRQWLVIDELDPASEIDETNILPRIPGPNVDRTPPPDLLPWGRVVVERVGNTVHASTVGVLRFTLLLSPEEFDFDLPVSVFVDGLVAFEGNVTPDVRTLLSWHAVDDDRETLFGVELQIVVPR